MIQVDVSGIDAAPNDEVVLCDGDVSREQDLEIQLLAIEVVSGD